MIARAALKSLALALAATAGVTLLALPAIYGLYQDEGGDRLAPDTGPDFVILAIGICCAAMAMGRIDTSGERAGRPQAPPPLIPTLVQVLLIGPVLGVGLAASTLLLRALSMPSGGGPGLWNDYLTNPLAPVILGLVVWSLADLGVACGSFLAGAPNVLLSCVAAAGLLVSLFGSPALLYWLHLTEPGPVLLLVAALAVPASMLVTLVAAAQECRILGGLVSGGARTA